MIASKQPSVPYIVALTHSIFIFLFTGPNDIRRLSDLSTPVVQLVTRPPPPIDLHLIDEPVIRPVDPVLQPRRKRLSLAGSYTV